MSLQYALLGLLNKNEMTGYELNKIFEDDLLKASISQIYRELNLLEKKGLLSSVILTQADKPDKRLYSITPDGKSAFQNWIIKFPEKLTREIKDEFSMRLLFGANLEDSALIREFERMIGRDEKKLSDIQKLEQLSQKHLKKMEFFEAEALHWKFIFRRAQITLEANIAWAKECLEVLKKGRE